MTAMATATFERGGWFGWMEELARRVLRFAMMANDGYDVGDDDDDYMFGVADDGQQG